MDLVKKSLGFVLRGWGFQPQLALEILRLEAQPLFRNQFNSFCAKAGRESRKCEASPENARHRPMIAVQSRLLTWRFLQPLIGTFRIGRTANFF